MRPRIGVPVLWLAFIAPAVTRAEPPAPRWEETGVLAAAEAHQAAAADGRFVYAISSTQVAKYDRQTGERVGVSTGEAHHLNSGFFHEGKLHCAHSNFPRTPERSEIMVLDPETMRLTTHKDFGNYGGSLTWVVRHDGHWWCNFARYGDDNAETFLVQFDDDWNEIRRWTYPAEVIAELGRYSLSGGLWRDDSLLVTGHDDPVLFRLRLPREGRVLELVEVQPCPFSGQGIAHDPKTGGLVGIRRGKRQVVFASQPKDATDSPSSASKPLRLRVLSYNIHHAEGVDRQLDLERIARVIRSARPDIVALQEVDQKTARTGKVDQPAELARLTDMPVVFGKNIDFEGGGYGNAVLSRFPIEQHKNHHLPSFDDGEQRGVLDVEIKLPGDRGSLRFLATHLDHRRAERERLASAKAINELIAKHPDQPALLAGDLNAVPDSETLKRFESTWTKAGEKIQPTIPVGKPARQIDYVLYRPKDRWKVIEVRILDEAVASDHRAILAVLELLPAED